MWIWPTLSGVLAAALACLLGTIRPTEGFLAQLWPSDTSAAATLVQLVATAAVTATTLTFSITVVALQLASQQFSPRLLRRFAHDPVIKTVLSVLTATFTYAVAGLRTVHQDRSVPTLMILGAALLGLAAFAAVLAFVTHMFRTLRVDTAIEGFYPAYDESVPSPDDLDLDAATGRLVTTE